MENVSSATVTNPGGEGGEGGEGVSAGLGIVSVQMYKHYGPCFNASTTIFY